MANYPPYMNFQHPVYGYPYGQTGMTMPAVQPVQNYPSVQPVQPSQPVQPAPSPAAQSNQQGIMCFPVTSRAEADAQRVEAFGPAFVMLDFGHGMIYYKKFNNETALADFAEFKIVPRGKEQEQAQQESPKIDYMAILGAFTGRLDSMDKKIDEIVDRLETKAAAKQQSTPKGAAKE